MLGDPPILVLDELLNGLDPEGIIWFRGLIRQMAAERQTVLAWRHLITEMSVTADHLLAGAGADALEAVGLRAAGATGGWGAARATQGRSARRRRGVRVRCAVRGTLAQDGTHGAHRRRW